MSASGSATSARDDHARHGGGTAGPRARGGPVISRRAHQRALPTISCLLLVATLLAGCDSSPAVDSDATDTASADTDGAGPAADGPAAGADASRAPTPEITLAFAGDVHFEGAFTRVPGTPRSTLGPMSGPLREADLAMVNLESALTDGGTPAAKELEVPSQRYWFRSPQSSLGVLDRSGVDVVSVANNHGADYGAGGLRDTLRIGRYSPVAVVGVGSDVARAFSPHRVSVKGTDVAVFAADASPRESDDPTWAARPGTGPGLAAARGADTARLAAGVRTASLAGDLVVVYLHWGEEGAACPTQRQRGLARVLTGAGADIVVGTHAHVTLGSGMMGKTYVSYGLGNFFWYHGRQSDSGVLRLTVKDRSVVREEWLPARLPLLGGAPRPLAGAARTVALEDWRGLRGCTGLAPSPAPAARDDGSTTAR